MRIKRKKPNCNIRRYHESFIGGPRGITNNKTYQGIREKYFWTSLMNDLTEYIRDCRKRQKFKLVRIENKKPMIITYTSLELFYKISILTVRPLLITPRGNNHILTIHDNLTKYCIVVAVPNTKAETVANAVGRHVISIYGSLRIILSDQALYLQLKLYKN